MTRCFLHAITTLHQLLCRQMLTCSSGVAHIPPHWCHMFINRTVVPLRLCLSFIYPFPAAWLFLNACSRRFLLILHLMVTSCPSLLCLHSGRRQLVSTCPALWALLGLLSLWVLLCLCWAAAEAQWQWLCAGVGACVGGGGGGGGSSKGPEPWKQAEWPVLCQPHEDEQTELPQ